MRNKQIGMSKYRKNLNIIQCAHATAGTAINFKTKNIIFMRLPN